MKQDMRSLLSEIKRAHNTKAHETFDKLAFQIKRICEEFYEETGCSISGIRFPVEAMYVIGKKEPSNFVPLIPEIEIRELNL